MVTVWSSPALSEYSTVAPKRPGRGWAGWRDRPLRRCPGAWSGSACGGRSRAGVSCRRDNRHSRNGRRWTPPRTPPAPPRVAPRSSGARVLRAAARSLRVSCNSGARRQAWACGRSSSSSLSDSLTKALFMAAAPRGRDQDQWWRSGRGRPLEPVVPDWLQVRRQRAGARDPSGFPWAVEVRAARGQEAVATRHVGVLAGLVGRMAAGVHFDALAAQLDELIEQRGELQRRVLAARVRDDGARRRRVSSPRHRPAWPIASARGRRNRRPGTC